MTENQKEFETLPAEQTALALQNETSMFFNIAKFEHAQRLANMFYQAQMWPTHLKTVGDALIVLNLAERLRTDPVMLAQTIYIIHGKPGLEGKLVKALIDNSGKYKVPLRYKWVDGDDKEIAKSKVVNNHNNDYRGCVAFTIGADGQELEGPKVSWHTVHSEGWYNKKGSKWPNMAELMFIYRASSWFANTNCPEVKLGMQTTEELRDIDTLDLVPNGAGSFAAEESSDELAAKILAGPGQDKQNGNVDASITDIDRDMGKANGPTIEPEKFPDVLADTPKPEPAPVKGWDPLTAPLQKKYSVSKQQAIMAQLDARGIEYNPGWYGKQLHSMLLADIPQQDETEAPPENTEPDPPPEEAGLLVDDDLFHRDTNRRLQADFPMEWDKVRADNGWGLLCNSEDQAERWNKAISAELDKKAAGQ